MLRNGEAFAVDLVGLSSVHKAESSRNWSILGVLVHLINIFEEVHERTLHFFVGVLVLLEELVKVGKQVQEVQEGGLACRLLIKQCQLLIKYFIVHFFFLTRVL